MAGQPDIWESQHFRVSTSRSSLTTHLRWILYLPPNLSAGYCARTLMSFNIEELSDDTSSLDSVSATKSEWRLLCPDPDDSVARQRRRRE